MIDVLPAISEDIIGVRYLLVGENTAIKAGSTESLVYPATVVVQVYEGRCRVTIPDDAQTLESCEACIIPGGIPATYAYEAGPNGVAKVKWLHAHFALYSTVDFVSLMSPPLRVGSEHGRIFGETISEMLHIRPREAACLEDAARLRTLVKWRELAFRILHTVCDVSSPNPRSCELFQDRHHFAPVLTYVSRHLGAPMSARDLANQADLSLSRFHVLFKNRMGMSPMAYVKEVRLNTACQMLMVTGMTIYAIAEAVGFANPYHFSREFKSLFGLSPSQFRRDHIAGEGIGGIGV